MSDLIPDDYAHLLERPLYGHLGTIRPDDTVQVNPMWFEYDGTNLRFTHTRKRAKFRNLQHNPAMSFSIIDPDNQFRYLELRGRLADVEPDPTGAFYVRLGKRYGNDDQQPPPDSADRVVLGMSSEKTAKQSSGPSPVRSRSLRSTRSIGGFYYSHSLILFVVHAPSNRVALTRAALSSPTT